MRSRTPIEWSSRCVSLRFETLRLRVSIGEAVKHSIARKRQVTLTLSDQERAALDRLVEWRSLAAADVIRGLITREAEISEHLTPLQADAALGLAAKAKS
jgi:hypothetical protein